MSEKRLDIVVAAKGVAQTQTALGSLGKKLKELKKSDSGEGLEQLTNVLKGGGAIAGITALTLGLGHAADEARRMVNELAKGKATIGDIAEATLAGLPGVGQSFTSGRSVRHLLQDAAAGWLEADKNAKYYLATLRGIASAFGPAGAALAGRIIPAHLTPANTQSEQRALERAQAEETVLGGLNKSFQEAENKRRLIGLRDKDRQVEEARIRFDETVSAIKRDEATISQLDESRRGAELRKLQERRRIAQTVLDDEIAKIREEKNKAAASLKTLPASLDSRFLSGLGAAAREDLEVMKSISKNTAETNKQLVKLTQTVERRSSSGSESGALVAPRF